MWIQALKNEFCWSQIWKVDTVLCTAIQKYRTFYNIAQFVLKLCRNSLEFCHITTTLYNHCTYELFIIENANSPTLSDYIVYSQKMPPWIGEPSEHRTHVKNSAKKNIVKYNCTQFISITCYKNYIRKMLARYNDTHKHFLDEMSPLTHRFDGL